MLTLHANVNDLPEALRRLWTARDAGGAWRLALELPDEEQTEATLSLLVTAAVDGDASQTDFRRIADVLERVLPAERTPRQTFWLALALARCNAYRRALSLFTLLPLEALERDETIVAEEEMLRLRMTLFSPACSDEELLALIEPLMRPEAKPRRLAVLRLFSSHLRTTDVARAEEAKDGIRRLLTLTDDLTPEEKAEMLRLRILILGRIDDYLPPVLDDCFRLFEEHPESDETALTAFELVRCLLTPESVEKPLGSKEAWAQVETGLCPQWASDETKLFYRIAADVQKGAIAAVYDALVAAESRSGFFLFLRGWCATYLFMDSRDAKVGADAWASFDWEHRPALRPFHALLKFWLVCLNGMWPDEVELPEEANLSVPPLTPCEAKMSKDVMKFMNEHVQRHFRRRLDTQTHRQLTEWLKKTADIAPEDREKHWNESALLLVSCPGSQHLPVWWECALQFPARLLAPANTEGLWLAFRSALRKSPRRRTFRPMKTYEPLTEDPRVHVWGGTAVLLPPLFRPLWMRFHEPAGVTSEWAWVPEYDAPIGLLRNWPDKRLRVTTALGAVSRDFSEDNFELSLTVEDAPTETLDTRLQTVLFETLAAVRADTKLLDRLGFRGVIPNDSLALDTKDAIPSLADAGFAKLLFIDARVAGTAVFLPPLQGGNLTRYELVPLRTGEAKLLDTLGIEGFLKLFPFEKLGPFSFGRADLALTTNPSGMRAS